MFSIAAKCRTNTTRAWLICRNASYAANEFLHKSILPTHHFQDALPRLPIPKLEDSITRYIASVEALEGHPEVDRRAIENSKRNISLFMQHDGPFLQNELIKYDKLQGNSSYLAKAWYNMYLESRVPIVLNYNPFLIINSDPNPQMNEQILRATNMLYSGLKFMKTYNAGFLKPEVYYMKDKAKSESFQKIVKYLPNTLMLRYLPMVYQEAYPLDMSQYDNILCSTRIPHLKKDYLRKSSSRHMLVIRNGKLFTFNVFDKKGNIKSPSQIYNCLKHISEDNSPTPEHNLIYLTTEERDKWAGLRQHLSTDTDNSLALEKIDSSIFCITLDDSNLDPEDAEDCTKKLLYGKGDNFWFDKSLTLFISKNGEAGMNFEHSWGDGVAVLRFIHEMYDDSVANPILQNSGEVQSEAADVNLLNFKLDDKMKSAISEAKDKFHSETSRIKVSAQKYEKITKNYLKQKKVSPDGVLQLAIQIGHRRLFGHPTATYESCSTAAYKHGRTETLRSCTLEAQRVAKLVAESGTTKIRNDKDLQLDIIKLITESCNKHNKLTREAAMGQGFDRHLFMLKYVAENVLEKPFTPSIHEDNVYKVMNHFVLSTSTLASHAMSGGGFAPVVPDGFGVGYGVRDNYIGCNITSYENRDVKALVGAILESFDNIYTVLEAKED